MSENEEIDEWQKVFCKLNAELGNDVWGARLEGNGQGSLRLRIFINKEDSKELVLEKTKGKISNYSLVFTVLKQEQYANSLAKKNKINEAEKQTKKANSTTEAESTT